MKFKFQINDFFFNFSNYQSNENNTDFSLNRKSVEYQVII